MENRRDIYTDQVEERKRRIGHFGLRCVDADLCGEFYRDVFELTELEKPRAIRIITYPTAKLLWR